MCIHVGSNTSHISFTDTRFGAAMPVQNKPRVDGPYLTPEELAEKFRVPLETVYKWNKTGKGPRRLRIGRHVRYRVADVDEWLAGRFAVTADE
jgi:excisionase family DNA binding protein